MSMEWTEFKIKKLFPMAPVRQAIKACDSRLPILEIELHAERIGLGTTLALASCGVLCSAQEHGPSGTRVGAMVVVRNRADFA